MQWDNLYAKRTELFRRNSVREFLKLAGRPGIISFAGGLPDPELLPVQAMQEAAESALSRFGPRALQYGPSEGLPELREWIASRYAASGVTAENVLVTSGSQQALDLAGRVLLDEGAFAAVQNPTYLAALSAWSPYGAKFRVLDSLEGSALAYCIPNFRNPSGETMPESERRELLAACESQGVPLLEDDAYGELRFEGAAQRSLLDLCGSTSGPVFHAGTFSKVLSPGLRLGWIIANAGLISRLVQARQAADLHTSTFTQCVALAAIDRGVLDKNLPGIRAVYRSKRDAMLQALEASMPAGATWSRPEGGMFIMLRLAAGTDGRAVARRAMSQGVLVVPGEDFHIEGGQETIRLNFSHPTLQQIREGVCQLSAAIAPREASS